MKEDKCHELNENTHAINMLLESLNPLPCMSQTLHLHTKLPSIKPKIVDLKQHKLSIQGKVQNEATSPLALHSCKLPVVDKKQNIAWIEHEKYIGSLDFAFPGGCLKSKAPVHKDGIPPNLARDQRGAITARELSTTCENCQESKSWDHLNVMSKVMDWKPLPRAFRCCLFGARITSHRTHFT